MSAGFLTWLFSHSFCPPDSTAWLGFSHQVSTQDMDKDQESRFGARNLLALSDFRDQGPSHTKYGSSQTLAWCYLLGIHDGNAKPPWVIWIFGWKQLQPHLLHFHRELTLHHIFYGLWQQKQSWQEPLPLSTPYEGHRLTEQLSSICLVLWGQMLSG